MLEIILCSFLTILPDYLFRRFVQGKRIGREITLYSVWYELRWGITLCLMLTTLLITVIFYFHPTTTSASSFYRSIPILPEASGRVSEIYVGFSGKIEKGKPIFRLDDAEQQAAFAVAQRRVAEVDAEMVMAAADIAAESGKVQQALGALKQVEDELRVKQGLLDRKSAAVAPREIERLETAQASARGQVAAAEGQQKAVETRLTTLLPAQKASAEAELQKAQVDLDKRTVYAGVSGHIEQFVLRVGDIVNPFMRAAGILIPEGAGRNTLQAGFGQIEAQVMKVGMAAEATCVSMPLVIIPMVVTSVQDYIAAGQIRAGEQLIDAAQAAAPGTILVSLEPLYEGGLDGVSPGSSCIVNAYTNNHDRLETEDLGLFTRIGLHGVDAVALVHAAILRVQALMLPIRTLVLSGH
ncbi:HlyD family secretion protein [Aestuariivirga sp.]|uniref:HlyD family secretion protein n=1 Tax=Aestuariivirga sp. TaxID=2650926 RepID=UPI003BA8FEBD